MCVKAEEREGQGLDAWGEALMLGCKGKRGVDARECQEVPGEVDYKGMPVL